jgi:hypothetical protein
VEELVVPEKRHVIGTAWSDEAIKNEVAIRRIVLFMIGHPLWFIIQVTQRRKIMENMNLAFMLSS